jgi:GT2 family glycosyltransferase
VTSLQRASFRRTAIPGAADTAGVDRLRTGEGSRMHITVGIATVGRPDLLQIVLQELSRQSRPADGIIVCTPTPEDVGNCADTRVELVIGPRGLTRQRNAILARAGAADAVVFFDDDFLPAPSYLGAIERVLAEHPDVVMVTGKVIADGIIGPGLSVEEARHRLAVTPPTQAAELLPVPNGYGCNMAVRMSAVAAAGIRFDERLPLYGWLEDVDFSAQIGRYGRTVRALAATGVHLGVKRGRQSGIRLGYSQIANPIYLLRKGTCPWPRALRQMSKNITANCVRSLQPEPYVDRRGRVIGNIKALRDLLAGRLAPERIMEL